MSQDFASDVPPSKLCEDHNQEIILVCLKDQQKVCSLCLKSTHLFHPVVPLNSMENLDFTESLSQEI